MNIAKFLRTAFYRTPVPDCLYSFSAAVTREKCNFNMRECKLKSESDEVEDHRIELTAMRISWDISPKNVKLKLNVRK